MKSNKILVVLLIFIYLFSLSFVVKANDYAIMPLSTTSDEGYVYRNCYWGEYDTETDTYPFHYRIFNSGGKHEGVVKVPSNLYNLSNYFLLCDANGTVSLFQYGSQNASTTYTIGIFAQYYNSNKHILWNVWYQYIYNKDTETFGNSIYYKNGACEFSGLPFQANNFLYTKGLNMVYDNNLASLSLCQDFQDFEVPELGYMPADGGAFRIYLNDFHGSSIDNSVYSLTNGLTGLQLFVYDLKTNMYLSENLNLLAIHDVEKDDYERYYFDVKFVEVLPYLNTIDGDYLIVLGTTLTSSKIIYAIQNKATNPHHFRFTTLYTTIDYWRYQYSASSGSGLLVPTDSSGNPTNPSDPENPDNPSQSDKTADAIKDQTQKIEEQTGAIKDQTEKIEEQTKKIEEQTDAIKDANETNKNIFQKIIELPSLILDGLLNLFKSIFIPSDDFLGNYFSDLFDWFCDRLGFLSYPLELILDILNKILNINFGEPEFIIPDIHEPFTNTVFIHSTSFNFNSMLENNILKTVHDIYLILVDAVIIFALVNLAKKKFEEVTEK